jgi:DNA-binding LacI/PurR family transcriptional regulator
MSRRRAGATLSDVAAAAGVSTSAVSRAFTQGASIAEATRARVLSAAATLGYAPNLQARALAMRRSGLVAWIIPDAPAPFYDRVARTLTAALADAGLGLIAVQAEPDEPEDRQVERALRFRPDAAVVASATLDARTALILQRRGVPVLQFGRIARGVRAPRVVSDNHGGGAAIARHFVDRGFRRIGFVSGPADASPTRERAAGFIETLRTAGLGAARVPGADFGYAAGRAAASALLAVRPDCDAVFCAGDVLAIGLIDAVRAAGRRVPGDLAVAGFDDVPTAGYDGYALTTLRQDAEALAAATVQSLNQLLTGQMPADRVVPARLILRASTLG